MIFAPALVGALTSCRPVAQKEIVVSIPADGLWDRYPTPEAVCGLLDTIAWAGFNSIKVDVKPVVGYCEFESSYLEPMCTMKTRPGAHEDWDYAATFIREGLKRGLMPIAWSAITHTTTNGNHILSSAFFIASD